MPPPQYWTCSQGRGARLGGQLLAARRDLSAIVRGDGCSGRGQDLSRRGGGVLSPAHPHGQVLSAGWGRRWGWWDEVVLVQEHQAGARTSPHIAPGCAQCTRASQGGIVPPPPPRTPRRQRPSPKPGRVAPEWKFCSFIFALKELLPFEHIQAAAPKPCASPAKQLPPA